MKMSSERNMLFLVTVFLAVTTEGYSMKCYICTSDPTINAADKSCHDPVEVSKVDAIDCPVACVSMSATVPNLKERVAIRECSYVPFNCTRATELLNENGLSEIGCSTCTTDGCNAGVLPQPSG